jgi:PAS domain S-box-containing protein
MISAGFISLRARLLLLVLMAALPLLAVTLFANADLRRVAADDAKGEALRLARIAANDQRDSIMDTRQLLYALARLPETREPEAEACASLLSDLAAQYRQHAVLAVALPDGNIVCTTQNINADEIRLTEHTAFQKALQTGDFAVEDFLSDEIGGPVTLDVAYPILGEGGQTRAVAFASLDLTWLNRLAAEAQLLEGSSLTVVDQRGTILVRYPRGEDWIGKPLPEPSLLEAIRVQQGEGTIEGLGIDGEPRLFAFVPLFDATGEGDLYVAIGIPKAVAFADTNRVLNSHLLALTLGSGVALATAWVGSDLVVLRQVNRLVDVANRLGQGEMTTRTSLPYKGELGQLAYAFDHMAESLTEGLAERDHAEAALQESRRALYTLMSDLPGMAYRRPANRSWAMEFTSQGARDLTGYTAEALTGEDTLYRTLIHEADREVVQQEIGQAIKEGRTFEVTYRIRTAAGETKWVSDKGRGLRILKVGSIAIEGFVSDITERVHMQQLLEQRVADRTRELSALYDVMAVLNAAPDIDTALQDSLLRIMIVLNAETGTIHVLDETTSALQLAASAGVTSDLTEEIKLDNIPALLEQHNLMEGNVAGVGMSVGRELHPLLDVTQSGIYLGVPLHFKSSVLGTLGLIRANNCSFEEEEVSLAGLIAEELGVAVENARLQQQARQLAVVQERERLARELHDSVTQSLYSVTLLAEAGRQRSQAEGDVQMSQYLARLGEIGQQALKEMRLLVYELRPLVLRREGLAGALQQRLEAVEQRAGVRARLLVEGGSPTEWTELPGDVETALYRIALEALNNTLKHAAAGEVTVRLRLEPPRVSLEVADNGMGFDLNAQSATGGMGLTSMRERAEQVGAELDIQTAPGAGCTVRIQIHRRLATEPGPPEPQEELL